MSESSAHLAQCRVRLCQQTAHLWIHIDSGQIFYTIKEIDAYRGVVSALVLFRQ